MFQDRIPLAPSPGRCSIRCQSESVLYEITVVVTDALAPQRTFELYKYFNNGEKFFLVTLFRFWVSDNFLLAKVLV
jgi:hypothetical protein